MWNGSRSDHYSANKILGLIGQNISKDQTSQLNKALDSFAHDSEFLKGQRFTSLRAFAWLVEKKGRKE